MKWTKRLSFYIVALAVSLLIFACSDEGKYARLEIRLTDAPGDYEEVNIQIEGARVHVGDDTSDGGWKDLNINAGTYNLLDLTNGIDTLLGSIELPPGRVSQVRLLLGSENSVKINGVTHKLTTPSGQQSGLKVNVHADLVEGITYRVLLDFDVARSIVKSGSSGKYILKPVIRAVTEATSGAVAGTLSNPEVSSAVYAIAGTDTVGTSFTNDLGKFMIKGLPGGTYTISFSPATGFVIDDITDVTVSVGIVTQLGEVEVKPE